ncbi:MAG TPA: RluA family pseudouridine synthase [Acidobacteriaceae bacterium]
MPSKHMLPKGKRRQSVRAEYRAARTAGQERAEQLEAEQLEEATQTALPHDDSNDVAGLDTDPDLHSDTDPDDNPLPASLSPAPIPSSLTVDATGSGKRLDAYLAHAIPEISRARVQLLISAGQVRVGDGHGAGITVRPSHKLRAGQVISIEGEPRPAPLHATPEDIPLDILHEDEFLAVINKPAGMMVHAGAGTSDDSRNRGTLVNALLHHMQQLSSTSGELRPGIVHRLDKETSGAIVVAKDDLTHRKLSELFSTRRVKKTYLALVHGALAQEAVTVTLPIARDLVRRTRMTTRRPDGRTAISHVRVLERLATPYGPFTLVEVRIETGRTHQIRVHMQSLGHAVVGDTLYGAPRTIPAITPASSSTKRKRPKARPIRMPSAPEGTEMQSGQEAPSSMQLPRNFLHAAHLEFTHPRTGKLLSISAPLPQQLQTFLEQLKGK